MNSKINILLLCALLTINAEAGLFPLFRRNRDSSSSNNMRGGGGDTPDQGETQDNESVFENFDDSNQSRSNRGDDDFNGRPQSQRGQGGRPPRQGRNGTSDDDFDGDADCDEEEDGPCGRRPHHGGPGHHGPPHHYGNATTIENDCPMMLDDPVCTYDKRSNETGVWVCREEFDHETGDVVGSFSYCASPEFRLDTDTCGCCGDECPLPCSCGCELDDDDGAVDSDGVLVLVMDKYDDEEEVEEVCMDPERAYHKISKSTRYSCAVC